MPRPRTRSPAVPDLRRGRQPGEADQGPPCRKQALSAVETGDPCLPRAALANSCYRGEEGASKGVRDQLAARPQDEDNRADEVSAPGSPLFLLTARNPSRAGPAGPVRDGCGGTASTPSLNCAE